MKKWLLVLGMITCVFGASLPAQAAAEPAAPLISEEMALTGAAQIVEYIVANEAQYTASHVIEEAFENWTVAQKSIGSYVKTLDSTASINDDGAVVQVTVEGTKGNAVVEITWDKNLSVTGITTTPAGSSSLFSGGMQNTAVIVLAVLGAVFVVLILIGLATGFIPKMRAAYADQPEEKKQLDNTIAQIVEKEEFSDDLELVAVIAAAVAAAAGAVSADGFVVRSIRKRRVY